MDTQMVRIVCAVLAVLLLGIIVLRRKSELYIDEEEAQNLLLTIEEELQKRNRGAALRIRERGGSGRNWFLS